MGVVRYYLSLYVLLDHAVTLANFDVKLPYSTNAIVGSFFALSGFLLFPSFQKKPTWKHYVARRARRILPPYFLIVCLCAIIFVFVSDMPWREYFSNSGFWKYLAANLSFMNFAHPELPGVFASDNFTLHVVNGSLWTMKGEWACYLSVPFIFFAIKKFPTRSVAILWLIIITSLICAWMCGFALETTGNRIYGIIAKQFGQLLVYFYIGALINYYYPLFLRYRWVILIISLSLIIVGDRIPMYYLVLRPFAASALTLWFSMVGNWGHNLSKHDNVSYDIYLFHFPVIQLLIFFNLNQHLHPFAFIGLSALITTAFAFLSWNLIGKRFTKHRKL